MSARLLAIPRVAGSAARRSSPPNGGQALYSTRIRSRSTAPGTERSAQASSRRLCLSPAALRAYARCPPAALESGRGPRTVTLPRRRLAGSCDRSASAARRAMGSQQSGRHRPRRTAAALTGAQAAEGPGEAVSGPAKNNFTATPRIARTSSEGTCLPPVFTPAPSALRRRNSSSVSGRAPGDCAVVVADEVELPGLDRAHGADRAGGERRPAGPTFRSCRRASPRPRPLS